MLEPSYCTFMVKHSIIRAAMFSLASIAFAVTTFVMLYAVSRQFHWEFILIGVICMLLYHFTHTRFQREIDAAKMYHQHYKDATATPTVKRPACAATIIGQK